MSHKNVTVREAHDQLEKGYTYVDVRSVPEFVQGHPAGAVNVPLLHHDARTGQMMPNREFLHVMRANFSTDAKLLIGCQVGGRSVHAAQVLDAAGYPDVSNVLGGFGGTWDAEGWIQAGLPIEVGSPTGRSYDELRAHASVAPRQGAGNE